MERNVFGNQDVIGLAWVAPHGLEKERLENLGQILRQSIDLGNAVEDFVARVRVELKKPAKEAALTERQVAKAALRGRLARSRPGQFLPGPEKAVKDDDREALNLLARHYLALHDRDKKAVHLEQAWKVTQEALATGKVDREQKDEADPPGRRADAQDQGRAGPLLARGQLHPAARARHGDHRGHRRGHRRRDCRPTPSIPTSGPSRSSSRSWPSTPCSAPRPSAARSGRAAWPSWPRAGSRRPSSRTSSTSRPAWARGCSTTRSATSTIRTMTTMSPEMMMQRQGNMPRALLTGDVVKNRPGEPWLALLDEGIKPKFATVFAQLYLKVNEEEKAFPYIESAVGHPPPAGQGAGRGVPQDLDQEPRPQLAAAAPEPVLLRLRVRIARGGHPADPLQAGAQPGRAGRLGQEAAQAADRRARREAADRRPSPPATARPRSTGWMRSTRSSARSTPSSRSRWPS